MGNTSEKEQNLKCISTFRDFINSWEKFGSEGTVDFWPSDSPEKQAFISSQTQNDRDGLKIAFIKIIDITSDNEEERITAAVEVYCKNRLCDPCMQHRCPNEGRTYFQKLTVSLNVESKLVNKVNYCGRYSPSILEEITKHQTSLVPNPTYNMQFRQQYYSSKQEITPVKYKSCFTCNGSGTTTVTSTWSTASIGSRIPCPDCRGTGRA